MRMTGHADQATMVMGPMLMGQPIAGPPPLRAPGYGYMPPQRHAADQAHQREREAYVDEQVGLRAWAGVRSEVVHRLVGMNLRHSMRAWTMRRDRPVAPWAVGFLYAYPTGTVYEGVALYRVVAATRLVDHDDELPGPAHLLDRLADVADQRSRDEHGWFDPTRMCTYRDSVPEAATYLGAALSCLGTAAEPWDTLRQGDSDDIPGHGYALLTDDTALMFTRTTRRHLRRVTIYTTTPVGYQDHRSDRQWRAHDTVHSIPNTDLDVWDQLYRLHVLAGRQRPQPTLEPEPGRGR